MRREVLGSIPGSLRRTDRRAIIDRINDRVVEDALVQTILDEVRDQGAILGEILASQGDEARAAGMWDASIAEPPNYFRYAATLAGFRRLQQQDIQPLPWAGIQEGAKTTGDNGD